MRELGGRLAARAEVLEEVSELLLGGGVDHDGQEGFVEGLGHGGVGVSLLDIVALAGLFGFHEVRLEDLTRGIGRVPLTTGW